MNYHLRKHPYAALSIVLHALGLTLFYYFGSYAVEVKRQEAQVQATAQAARHARTEARVHAMEKIKALLERSSASESDMEDDVDFSATSLPKPAKELLQEARTLSKSIDDIARDIKAEELAKALNIPKEEALDQITPPPAEPDAAPAEPAQVAEEIKKLEAKARETLIQRQKDLERQEQGINVSTAGAGTGAGQGQGGGGHGAGSAGISAQIGAFINRDMAMPKNASTSYKVLAGDIVNEGSGRIPALGTSAPVTGMGRMIGADGQFANRVFVNSWYLIGPFEGRRGHDLRNTPHYPPEQAVLLDAVYEGKGKRLLKWKYTKAESYPLIPPDSAEDAVYYGYTELMMDEAADMTMLIGADDDAQVWLNDRMVWEGGSVNKRWFFHEIYYTGNSYKRDFNLNEVSRKVHFKKGRNKVFFKMSNGQGRMFFSMVLTK